MRQEVRFCVSSDGTRIAYAVHGSGPALVICTCWLSNLQHDWDSPVWRHFLEDLGRIATVIRFDTRGFGLSDRAATDFSLQARVADLEAVVTHAGLESFALLALAQGGPAAVEYTARHPDRVSRLAFFASSALGLPETDDQRVFDDMIRVGWARKDSVFRRVFTSLMIPGATEEQARWLDELQRVAVDADTLIASRAGRRGDDARPLLKRILVPALVVHARGDRMMPFEEAVELASALPHGRLVPLEGDNHIMLPDDPSRPVVMTELDAFLREDSAPSGGRMEGAVRDGSSSDDVLGVLSEREREVLGLAARGLENSEIAAELFLSVRTVERHLQNAYAKLGVAGRSARTAAVARMLSDGPRVLRLRTGA